MDELKQLIRKALTPEAGSHTVLERTVWSWQRMALQLTPLIGDTGFQSLYSRAIHLAQPHCPHLSAYIQGQSTSRLFEKLREDLSALEPSVTHDCSHVLLHQFTELVSSMIGNPLTEQILRSAWDNPADQTNGREQTQ